MKRISIIVIISIIFNLCIIPCGFVRAENGATTETNTSTGSGTSQNTQSGNSEKENTTNTTTTSPTTTTTPKKTTSTTNNKATTNNTKTEIKKSSNAKLSNLGFNPQDFKGFKPETYTYDVTVPNNVEKINVYAKAQDAKAKVTSGTGNHNLDVGSNDIQILVTAEDGSTQTYTINVTREEEAKTEPTNNKATEVKNSDLKKLEIKGYTLNPSFSPDIYEYKLEGKVDVADLEVVTEGLNENVSIEVAGDKDLKER